MKRKDIGIVLAALCLSAALCAVPAGVFAVTDSALFSGAFTQNARRGSLDVTGDDVYLARVLREPGEGIYIESNANPDLYSQNVNINMISTSEIRITVLVNEGDAERAMNAVHDAFGLAD